MSVIDELANEIRRVDGPHTLSAGALAEALMPWIDDRIRRGDRFPYPCRKYNGVRHSAFSAPGCCYQDAEIDRDHQ